MQTDSGQSCNAMEVGSSMHRNDLARRLDVRVAARAKARARARRMLGLLLVLTSSACAETHTAAAGAAGAPSQSAPANAANSHTQAAAASGGAKGSTLQSAGHSSAPAPTSRGAAGGGTASANADWSEQARDLIANDCIQTLACTASPSVDYCIDNSTKLLAAASAAVRVRFEMTASKCKGEQSCDYVSCTETSAP
jgi:hypothetical protein